MLKQLICTIKKSAVMIFFVLVICGTLSSCMHAKPWERQYHATPEMSLTSDPLEQKMSDHVTHSKEMSNTVTAGSGGGCGCY
jgi:hypothetical protein